jgi:hypothetical protein
MAPAAVWPIPACAALSNLTAAQVLIEAMSNTLKVYGADATQAMDASIRQIMPSAPADAVTANVRVTEQALTQARTRSRRRRPLLRAPRLRRSPRCSRPFSQAHRRKKWPRSCRLIPRRILNGVIQSAALATPRNSPRPIRLSACNMDLQDTTRRYRDEHQHHTSTNTNRY